MTASAAWQLTAGLLMVLVVFVLASGARRTWAIGLLLVLIPFQIVDTQYASSSILMAYVLAGVLLINGQLKPRMLPAIGLVVLAYLVSLTQSSRDILSMHLIELFQFFSCFAVFLLAYNFALLVKRERTVMDILLAINVLTVIYCALQLSAGPGERFDLFGIDAFQFNQNRHAGDARLVGPISNPGSTAGYFTLMVLVCAVELMQVRGRRKMLVQTLIGLNLIGLVATGNRAGLLVLVAMFPVMLFLFRRELGARRVAQYTIGGATVLVVALAVAAAYTDFGRMLDRMGTVTETENGVPTTRALTWPLAIAKIKQHPLFGEGPHFVTIEDAEKLGRMRSDYAPYPHSLYLYLLRTVGVIGLIAMLWFFVQSWRVLYRAFQRRPADEYQSALLRLGLMLIPTFLIAQITLEFIRPVTMDYAHFIYALIGMLIGISDRVPIAARAPTVAASTRSTQSAPVSPTRPIAS